MRELNFVTKIKRENENKTPHSADSREIHRDKSVINLQIDFKQKRNETQKKKLKYKNEQVERLSKLFI